MRKLAVLFFLFFSTIAVNAQTGSDEIIDQGVALHDKGEYESALRKYDEVLKSEPANTRALYEKSYTLIQMKRYDECEAICKQLLKGKEYRKEVYVQYGNLLDITDRQKEALELFDKGIREFPDFSLLYFNKGITLSGLNRNEEAITSYQQGLKLKPLHASSHYVIAKLEQANKRVPAIMAVFTFLVIEPQTGRSKECVQLLYRLMNKGVSQNDSGNVTIAIDASLLDDKKKKSEDDFTSAELTISLGASMAESNQDVLKDRSKAERLKNFFELVVGLLEEGKKKDKGFYKKFYVPFLVEMKSKQFLETASHIALISTNDEEVNQWMKDNEGKVKEFYGWLNNYAWNTK